MRPKKGVFNLKNSGTEKQSESKEMRQRLAPGAVSEPYNIRSISLAGLLVLAIFYTIYFMRAV